ncbi:MAG: cyclic nucleotide-binding domain-containing protein [Fimbriimonadaceae bacterium]|nr:cyclic nucleotide-binding domain-containing protein [Fimbriimonadaceae bacterium]
MVGIEELKGSYLFKGLSEDQLTSVLGVTQERNYPGGETVVRQFEKATDILVILGGSVKIKGFGGEDIAELGVGSVVGEVSLVDSAPRSATVIASGPTRAALINAEGLTALMNQDMAMKATVMETLCKVLCSRLRTTNIQLDSALSSRS